MSVSGDGPGWGCCTSGANGFCGTSAPPKLAVCGAFELFTKVTESPAFTSLGVGAKARTSVCAVDAPICTVHVLLPSLFLVLLGFVAASFFFAARPSARYFVRSLRAAAFTSAWMLTSSSPTVTVPTISGCSTQ